MMRLRLTDLMIYALIGVIIHEGVITVHEAIGSKKIPDIDWSSIIVWFFAGISILAMVKLVLNGNKLVTIPLGIVGLLVLLLVGGYYAYKLEAVRGVIDKFEMFQIIPTHIPGLATLPAGTPRVRVPGCATREPGLWSNPIEVSGYTMKPQWGFGVLRMEGFKDGKSVELQPDSPELLNLDAIRFCVRKDAVGPYRGREMRLTEWKQI